MSLVHGGPAIRCFSPGLYHSLVNGVRYSSVDISDVYDPELRNCLLSLINCQSVPDAPQYISQPSVQRVLDLAGMLKPVESLDDIQMIANETVGWFLLGRVCSSLERLKDGLSVLGILQAVVDHPDLFRSAYCYVPETLTVDIRSSLFKNTSRTDAGSNAHATESLVRVSLRDTGCKDVPPLSLELTLGFFLATQTK